MSSAPASVLADPLATAPRRAWAASVAGEDPERAAYVVASIDALAARLRQRRDGPDSDAAGAHAGRLLRKNRDRWSPRVPDVQWGFSRGFPEMVFTTVDAWVRDGAALRRAQPILHLQARGPGGGLVGHLQGLRSLSLADAPQSLGDLEALLADPAFAAITWLDLSRTGLGLAAIDALAGAAPALRYLGFEGNPEGDPTARWVDADGALAPEGGTAVTRESWGRPAWLELPAFVGVLQLPALYYPYPDLP